MTKDAKPHMKGGYTEVNEAFGGELEVCQGVRGVLSAPLSHRLPTPTQITFGTYGADEQLCTAPDPPGCRQHRQASRAALTHEQPHSAAKSTLMQAESALPHLKLSDRREARREMEFRIE